MTSFEILENSTRRKILSEFFTSQKIVNYNDIKLLVNDDTSRPDYHLNLLVEHQLIKRTKGRGNYILNELMIQPLRNFFNIKAPICLLGGLGKIISLYIDILDALRKVSIIPAKYIIITSPEIKSEFKKIHTSNEYSVDTIIQTHDYQTILRESYSNLENYFEKIIKNEIFEFEIICELTGSTKPVSIALMKLAENYSLQRIYFSGKKLIWL